MDNGCNITASVNEHKLTVINDEYNKNVRDSNVISASNNNTNLMQPSEMAIDDGNVDFFMISYKYH